MVQCPGCSEFYQKIEYILREDADSTHEGPRRTNIKNSGEKKNNVFIENQELTPVIYNNAT